MAIELSSLDTFALSMVVLFLGGVLARRVRPLREYNIPDPVIGGMVFAIVAGAAYYCFDVQVQLDDTLMTPMMLAFFAKIGLSANIRLLKQGGSIVFRFFFVALGLVIAQDVVGVIGAHLMGLDHRIGLLAGSITMSGGHGTGVSWAANAGFSGIPGATEIAVACATFGLISGAMIGGPIAQWLIARYRLAPADKVKDADKALKGHGYDQPETVTPKMMLEMLFLTVICVLVGQWLHRSVETVIPSLPEFVCVMFTGIFVRNILEMMGAYRIPAQTSDLVGVIAMSVFLSIAMMKTSMSELVPLAGPLIVLMILQIGLATAWTIYITFRYMGKDYEASVITSGHTGFGLGATATAIANMEAMVMRYGPAPSAFLAVPLVGAFFIDIANLGVIQVFLLILGY